MQKTYFSISKNVFFACLLLLACCGKKEAPLQDQLYCEIDGVAWQSTRMQVTYSALGSITTLDIYAYNSENELLYLKIYAIGNALTTHYINAQNQHNLAYALAGNLNTPSATYQTKGNCIGDTGSFIQLNAIESFFANGSFQGKICLPNGQFKTIRNGAFNQVRLP